jgi:hypothetical protein
MSHDLCITNKSCSRCLQPQSTYTVFLVYSVCPLVRIGTPTLSPASECVLPRNQRRVRGRGVPIRTTGEKAYSTLSTLCLLPNCPVSRIQHPCFRQKNFVLCHQNLHLSLCFVYFYINLFSSISFGDISSILFSRLSSPCPGRKYRLLPITRIVTELQLTEERK